MSISIIIVNWNSGKLLMKCLSSVKSQTILPDKIFVVDNDSTIQTDFIPQSSGNLEVIRLSSNIGFAAANNKAIEKCNTKYIALLNPDAFPEPHWIESLLRAADKYPNVASFGSKQLRYEDPNIIDGTGDIYHISGLVWRDQYGSRQKTNDNVARYIFSPCAAAAMYKRQPLLKVGGFDGDYFCYIEDVDLGFRLRLAGYSSMYIPDAVVHHVGSATTGGPNSNFIVYHCHRNLIWTYVKNMPCLLFWFLLPLNILVNILAVILISYRGQGHTIFRAKLDAIKALKTVWKKRIQIQEQRAARTRSIWQYLDHRILFFRGQL